MNGHQEEFSNRRAVQKSGAVCLARNRLDCLSTGNAVLADVFTEQGIGLQFYNPYSVIV